MLGGEVHGLNGETAIAVRLPVSTPTHHVVPQDGEAPTSCNSIITMYVCSMSRVVWHRLLLHTSASIRIYA